MTRSKPVVAAAPLGAATAAPAMPALGFVKPPLATGAEDAEPAYEDGFAKPPLVGGDAAMGGGVPAGDAEPGLVKPPLDGDVGEREKFTLPQLEPLLWPAMCRP